MRTYKRLSRLHIAARPLILRLWRRAARTGMPVARPLYLHHPEDATAREQDQQWLLGRDVLVAPVVEEGARGRRVYFPGRPGGGRQCWVQPETGRRFGGPATRSVRAPLGRLPYFFRCGTRPFGRAARRRPQAPRRRPDPCTRAGRPGGVPVAARKRC